MKEKYFDIVSSELFNYPNIENILAELCLSEIYVVKTISKREDLNFVFPKSKTIKPAFLFNDISLYSTTRNQIPKNSLILGHGKSLSSNTNILSTKSSIHLFDPISPQTSIDEGLARIAKQNQKIIFFDIGEIRKNQNKAIKQMTFILELLKKHKVEFRFITLAKVPEDLVDPIILQDFLKNFSLEKPLIKRIITEKL